MYLAYLGLDLIFGCRFIRCGLPLSIEIFLVTLDLVTSGFVYSLNQSEEVSCLLSLSCFVHYIPNHTYGLNEERIVAMRI